MTGFLCGVARTGIYIKSFYGFVKINEIEKKLKM